MARSRKAPQAPTTDINALIAAAVAQALKATTPVAPVQAKPTFTGTLPYCNAGQTKSGDYIERTRGYITADELDAILDAGGDKFVYAISAMVADPAKVAKRKADR